MLAARLSVVRSLRAKLIAFFVLAGSFGWATR
jgi:hypothetical protein